MVDGLREQRREAGALSAIDALHQGREGRVLLLEAQQRRVAVLEVADIHAVLAQRRRNVQQRLPPPNASSTSEREREREISVSSTERRTNLSDARDDGPLVQERLEHLLALLVRRHDALNVAEHELAILVANDALEHRRAQVLLHRQLQAHNVG